MPPERNTFRGHPVDKAGLFKVSFDGTSSAVKQADGKARKTAVQQLGVLNENRTGPERVCPVTALSILDSPLFSV